MLKHAGDVDYFCRFHPNVTVRISVAPQKVRPSFKRMPGSPSSRTDRFLVMVDCATFGPNRDPGVRT